MPDTNRKPLSPNQQRIMDVLLQDALKAPAPLPAPGRRLVPRPRRKTWASVAVTVACLVVVALAVGYALTRPPAATANTPIVASNTPVSTPRETAPRPDTGNQAGPRPQPEPLPEPEPGPRPEPGPEPLPQPQPEPEPRPVRPPDQVENPPVPRPEPEPSGPKPDRPDTQPGPALLVVVVGKVVGADRNAKLRLRYGEQDWRDYDPAKPEDLLDGVKLSCRKPVDLSLGGALVRLQGDLTIHDGEQSDLLDLAEGDLYLDTEGGPALRVHVSGHAVRVDSGAALIERGAADTDLSVFHGSVLAAGETVAAGKRGVLKKRGLAGTYDLTRKPREHEMLKTLPDRVLYREEFNTEKPEGRLRAGSITDGALVSEPGDGKPQLFWGYPRDLPHLDGLVIRLRVRFTDADAVTFSQFCPQRNDNFSRELKPEAGWQILEIRAADLRDRATFKDAPKAGVFFQNFSLLLKGRNPRAELDWVEVVRRVN
jgi:hypothetical protein